MRLAMNADARTTPGAYRGERHPIWRGALRRDDDSASIDWAGTQAYSEELGYHPSIRFNVKGREPQGVVTPDRLPQLTASLIDRPRSAVRSVDRQAQSSKKVWTP